STTVGGPFYLTAGPFDFSRYTNMKLKFQRWLNTDDQPYVYATIEISTNGSSWSLVWSNANGGSPPSRGANRLPQPQRPPEMMPSDRSCCWRVITDTNWTSVSYNISAYADNRSTVYVRWSHRVATGAWAMPGWNIDDVEFLGVPPPL